MATEREANLARDQNASSLRDLGAHAISVDEVTTKGEKTFAIIAFFEEKPEVVPRAFEVKSGKKTVRVPVIPRVMERFKPE